MIRRAFFPLVLLLLLALPAQAASSMSPAMMSAFGGAVAIGDHEIFIGEAQSFSSPGLVHIYRHENGAWALAAQLSSPAGFVGDGFGSALAVDGNRLLVSSSQANDGNGIVHVFEKQGTTWMHTAQLTPSDVMEGDQFGAPVALAGDYALVGASRTGENRGAVYVFRKDPASTEWVELGPLTASGLEDGDRFGASIVIDGDRALVSAPGRSDGAGAVYAYHMMVDTDMWVEDALITADEAMAQSNFGAALALEGDQAVIGAPNANRANGMVYLFSRNGNAWTQQTALAAPDTTKPRLIFGAAVALNDGNLWVTAPGTNGFSGALHRYASVNGAWQEVGSLMDENGQPRAFLGGAFDVKGDWAVAGATGSDYGEGSALIFARSADGTWRQDALVFHELEPIPPVAGGEVNCTEGEAASFACKQVDLVSFIPNEDLGMNRGVRLNDVWGWTDPETGSEYALIGHMEGTAFVDLSNPLHPVYLGTLDRTEGSPGATWRDIKVYNNHAFIVADGSGEHGMQVFDLTKLRNVENAPVQFEADAHYDRIASVHNIVINEETGFAYAVGSGGGGETCGGGLHMINIQDPLNPTFAGCFADPSTGRSGTGYSHDAQCVVYHGPDADYQGKEICFGANETAISISDVSDKENPVAVGSGTYPDYAYVHQGWLSDDHRFFFQNDELDELSGKTERTRTLIWDVSDLNDPVMVGTFLGDASSTDHNLYIKGNLMYQTNNASGLRIIDVSNPQEPVEVGFFDTTPRGENVSGFDGTWSSFPYFDSGLIVVTSRREGVFVLKKADVDI